MDNFEALTSTALTKAAWLLSARLRSECHPIRLEDAV